MSESDKIGRLVVLLIDMQDGLMKTSEQQALIPAQVRVLKLCLERRGIPIVYLELEGASYGQTNYRLLEIIDTFQVQKQLKKSGRNGFVGTKLATILSSLGAGRLLVMGISSCGCVYETALEAVARGFSIITSFDLIAAHCDEREYRLSTVRPLSKRACPFCADRTRWFRETTECIPLENIMKLVTL